jgi:uncharacterized membrane protein YhaH (DUF805 family)
MKAFSGRINRKTYWAMIALSALLLTGFALMFKSQIHIQEVVLALLCIPRLHDIGKSGWLFLWGIGAEIVGIILSFTFLPTGAVTIGLGLATLAIAGLVIWLGCIPGQKISNRFGEPTQAGIQWKRSPSV